MATHTEDSIMQHSNQGCSQKLANITLAATKSTKIYQLLKCQYLPLAMKPHI